MKFTVVWQPSALNHLAELWNAGPGRSAITQAANRIDRALLSSPTQQGEERDEGIRILIDAPLAVYFTVSEPDRMVTVFAVWQWS